jgi:Domain of unknown function (DUF4395)
MGMATWMDDNLSTQGYCLSEADRRGLRIGLRFTTGVCLGLVATGLVFESPAMLFGLAAIALVGGFAPRHPLDLVWNHAVRHVVRAPALPPNPPRRRHAFKLASGWLLVVSGLFAAGLGAAALVLGSALIAACATVTLTNLCLPSVALAWWERRHARDPVAA